ncbi:isoleucine--tRNA ligase [Adhaeretor mobilis]|nr:isoleucine--tRNA ligase [Adhaeretor mobilis]
MFPPVDKEKSFPQREEAILDFWKENGIYEKTLAARAEAPPFVFYEGPPTANGMPHPGHCLTRSIKDLFPRYKTMRGYRCERKAGWDTHGLPVEVEVCKELGIHSKEDIENYGIEPFIQLCQKSVWRYMQEWERLTERLGFWVNLEEAYVTYHQSYVESVWWSLKQLFDRGLLYQGHKIVWWWAQGGTALSAGEVGQGYREVADPSVFVKFPLLEDGQVTKTSLVVWTTTPWTLPSNQFAAVHPEIEYSTVEDAETGEGLVLASDLVETLATKIKRDLKVVSTCLGKELIGRRYVPPFDTYYTLAGAQHRQSLRDQAGDVPYKLGGAQRGKLADNPEASETEDWLAWRVVAADFVTTESGSGIVHQAPAFGEVDYDVLVAEQARFATGEGPTLVNCVAPDGKFTDEAPEFVRGRWVKDCDKDINRDLKERGLMFHQEQYLHDYPFCWRAEEDPLIQYPRESWFIKTTEFKDAMLANNAEINWLPEHIKGGRFGKFLESNVDWALSRERFWGTPLPVWVCEACGRKEAVGDFEEILAKPQAAGFEVWDEAKAKNPELPDDLRVHKPYIDAVTFSCECGATMQRVTEVIDCWYDSGAMPFAQWGYRGQEDGPERERFESQFPADFISEALDQTRGWFYSQVAISTMLFGDNQPAPHPFKNCIVLGLMLGEDGQKMSKSKRNYRAPSEIFDLYGADALRWYFFANQPPWTSIRYSEQAIKDSVPEFLLRLWNVYSFFTIYANIDGFEPQSASFGVKTPSDETFRPAAERGELDRWILSELHRTLAIVVERMDEYDNYNACQGIIAFVDALSNWYVRRSRDRFWAKDKQDRGKLDAYWTLYECLITTTKMIAPFTPFLAENLWQQLSAQPLAGSAVPESVHLCEYPESDTTVVDAQLSERMDLVRLISSLGRNARTSAELKVRQPLAKVEVILADPTHQAWLAEHANVIAEELNVKAVEFSDQPEKYVDYQVLPNFKLLGKKLGKLMPKVKQALGKSDGAELLTLMKSDGKVTLEVEGESVELTDDEIEVRLSAKEGWAAANDRGVVVVLATELTDELVAEGLARDLVRVIQDRRKELGCEFTDRIEVGAVTESKPLQQALSEFQDYLAGETLSNSILTTALPDVEATDIKIGEHATKLFVKVVSRHSH